MLSILAHVGLLVYLQQGGSGDGGGKDKNPGPTSVKVTIIDKPSDKQEEAPPPPPNAGKILVKELEREKKKIEIDDCPQSYGGIGVTHDPWCYVTQVGAGYPADRAGIKVGDQLAGDVDKNEGSINCPGKGEVGTKITVAVMRDLKMRYVTMTREKICQAKEEEQP